MADVDYDDYDSGYVGGYDDVPPLNRGEGAPGPTVAAPAGLFRLSWIVKLGAALASLGFILWLSVWGYGEAVRDARGIPIFHASKEPMKIAPADPGGSVVEHQGLSVNDVAAVGMAAPPPDRLMLAPRPIELTDEDKPGLAGLAPAAPAAADPSAGLQPVELALGTAPPLAASEAAAAPQAAPLAAVPVAAAPVADTAAPSEDPVAAALAEALGESAPEATTPAAESAAPPPRPDAMVGQGATAPALARDAPTMTLPEIDPATISPGTRLAQLGAFDTAEDARAEWVRLTNRYGDVLAGHSLVVQTGQSGGETFYRLRVGSFPTEDKTRSFCAGLVERGVQCIPVIHE